MSWIKKIKKIFIRDKISDDQHTKYGRNSKKHRNSPKVNDSIDNVKKADVPYSYERFSKLKVYKRPIIDDLNEREQLHNQISKELEKLD